MYRRLPSRRTLVKAKGRFNGLSFLALKRKRRAIARRAKPRRKLHQLCWKDEPDTSETWKYTAVLWNVFGTDL
jgi:hypothetical protein